MEFSGMLIIRLMYQFVNTWTKSVRKKWEAVAD